MSNFDEKDLLTRELRERSADVGGHPIGFDAVRRSARRIKRRRQAVSGAVAAAVAGVALPTGVAVTSAIDSPDGRPDSNQVATSPTDEASPTPTPTPRPDGSYPLTVRDLPRGPAAAVSYVQDGRTPTLVTPNGSFDLPSAYQQVVPYDDGWLALGYEGEGAQIFMLSGDMDVEHSFSSGQTLAVSGDQSRVAYVQVEEDGSQTLVNAPADGSDPQTWGFPEGAAVEPVGLAGADSVVYQTRAEDGTTTVGVAAAEGLTELPSLVRALDANMTNGLVLGQTRSDLVNGSCYAVMDAQSSEMVWETCDYSLMSFSPQGDYIAASIPDFDGLGAPSLTVLDAATHSPLVEYSNSRKEPSALVHATWEDEDTVVGVVNDAMTFAIERFELDGRNELVAEPVEADPYADFPFWLAGDRW